MLAILKFGINVNNCTKNIDCAQPLDNKAALTFKFPKVFEGLGKLKGYQLKLQQDGSIPPMAQPLRRIPFSRRQKVTAKLKQLEELDVIEKVNGPTSWINPLVCVEKPNGDIGICLDMRQANRAILREKHPDPTVEESLQEISEEYLFSPRARTTTRGWFIPAGLLCQPQADVEKRYSQFERDSKAVRGPVKNSTFICMESPLNSEQTTNRW